LAPHFNALSGTLWKAAEFIAVPVGRKYMEASAISETLFMLAGRLQYLRVFFEHYEVGSPRGLLDQEFDRSVEAATYVVNGALESFKSTEFGPAHWETERRLRYVSRELRELIDRLDRIRDAVGVYSVSTDDMWHNRGPAIIKKTRAARSPRRW